MDETQEIIKTFYSMATPQVQAKINDPEWKIKVTEIGTKYGLNTDQQETLKLEVLFVLLAIQDPDSLVKNIESEISLSSDTAQKIRMEIDQMIFKELKNTIYQTVQEIDAVQPNQITPPQPSRITDIKRENVVSVGNAPANLPMMQEERELVVQAPIKTGLPKTFGEGVKPQNITPSAKPVAPLNLRGEAEPSVKQVQVPPSPPNLGGVPSPRGGVIPKPLVSPNDQFFVMRPKPTVRGIIDARLGGSLNLPQEKLNVVAPKPPQNPTPNIPTAPANPAKKVDPYREPIE